MTTQFLPMFCTSDASTSYGFGGTYASCSVDDARRLSRLDERIGDYVGLGERHALPLVMNRFKAAFSIKAAHIEHINIMEGHAGILMLKWVLRSPSRFGHRVIFGLDSKVWLGAVAKGRSSSPALAQLCRRVAALVMASGTVPHYVFLYTHENPSDAPSRGIQLAKL